MNDLILRAARDTRSADIDGTDANVLRERYGGFEVRLGSSLALELALLRGFKVRRDFQLGDGVAVRLTGDSVCCISGWYYGKSDRCRSMRNVLNTVITTPVPGGETAPRRSGLCVGAACAFFMSLIAPPGREAQLTN